MPDDTVAFALAIVDFLADNPGVAYSVTEVSDKLDSNALRVDIVLSRLAQVHLVEQVQLMNDDLVTYRARWPKVTMNTVA